MKFKDYYEILGLKKGADEKEIKSAYRKLARKFHPDVNKAKNAQEKFKDINEAYEVLSDKQKRSRYDNVGSGYANGSDFNAPPGFENINFGQGDVGGFDFGGMGGGANSGFSDFFESLFSDFAGGGAQNMGGFGQQQQYSQPRQKQPQRKPEKLDITQNIFVDLEDLMGESIKAVKVSYMIQCPSCHGQGSNCYNCGGSGFSSTSRTLNVKVPKGVKEGAKIRLAKEGKEGQSGQKGNLYLVIKIKKHSKFSVDGENIISNIEVSPSEAVLGVVKEIETLHGMVKVTIPKGTQSGKSLRLKELGLPKKSSGFGYHTAKILINIPEKLTKKEIELYKQILELEKNG